MTWSTRELADLAGTTINTVRHYHRLGLLEEPGRRYNGYKQYGVQDLVLLLRIRRLVQLSMPLSRIRQILAGVESTSGELAEVDSELETTIERLQRARADIATILRENAPADAPAGFVSITSRLSESDTSIIHIYTQLYDADAIADLRRMVEVDADEGAVGDQISALPPDADEETRQRLAERLAPTLAQHLVDYPWLQDPARHLSKNTYVAQKTFMEAAEALYNSAQLDVFFRAGALAQGMLPMGASNHEARPHELGAA